MRGLLNQLVPADQQTALTFQIIKIDNIINWVLGLSLILVPDLFNRLFFGHEVLSHWIYILIGVGLIWFAAWQVANFLKEQQLEVPPLRFAAVLAWLPVVALTIALLSGLGNRLLIWSKILLWIADVYMLFLGGWYWWVSQQLN